MSLKKRYGTKKKVQNWKISPKSITDLEKKRKEISSKKRNGFSTKKKKKKKKKTNVFKKHCAPFKKIEKFS